MHSYKKYDKTHHKQYLFAANLIINEFLCFPMHLPQTSLEQLLHVSRVRTAVALLVLLFVAFLQTAVGVTGLV